MRFQSVFTIVVCLRDTHSPSGNIVGVPVGVEVHLAYAHVLLCSLMPVDVVISKNNTPSPGPVTVQKINLNLSCLVVSTLY